MKDENTCLMRCESAEIGVSSLPAGEINASSTLQLDEIIKRLDEIRKRQAKLVQAAVDCCPDTWEARRIANEERPVYVEQLHYIESEEEEILRAVTEHARSHASRLDWYSKGYVTEEDVVAYEEHLIKQHSDIFKRKIIDGESDVVRGQETYNQCKVCSDCHQIDNREPYAGFSIGTLHKLANAKTIGWHPKWVERFCTGGK